MKKIMIAAGALLVLGGGGAGGYFYFQKPAEAATDATAAAQAGHEKDDHGKKEKHAKKGGHGEKIEFVKLDPLVLPIVDGDGISQIISLVIALEVPDAASKSEVEALIPRLKDAYIQEMYGLLNKHAAVKGGVLQVGYIKGKLSRVSATVLGEENFSDVLLQVVEQRPI
ncbi:MAG: flagellar basal body-associated FliL family protein [Alphaproteobacteria bacterium]|nr:flagellar basal body-associated FliL family protein [Alphaproteobacteria bacterium]